MPKGLYARALLIIIAPMVILQSVIAFVFMERHWNVVTQRLSAGVVQDVAALIDVYRVYPQDAEHAKIRNIAQKRLGLVVDFLPLSEMPPPGPKPFFSLLDQALSEEMRKQIARPFWIDTVGKSSLVEIRVQLDNTVMRVFARRGAAYASNSEIFLLWMVGTSTVLLIVAIIFLRNQIKPILRLADAAESFGKGREVPNFRPRGAREVRRAAQAFIEMKTRVERAIEQRTAMLAGVSHDLRTVLTRFKLELALIDDGPEVEAMKKDVDEMARMLEAYLAFARGDLGESAAPTDMAAFLEELKVDAERHGHKASVVFHGPPIVTVRPAAFKRCLANLVSNAARYAPSIEITGHRDHRYLTVTVDDDGPGIPADLREEVFKPFLRLDDARNQDEGGTGLGPGDRARHRAFAWRRHHARRQPARRLARDRARAGLAQDYLSRFGVLIACAAAPARAAQDAFRNRAQIVDESGPAFGAGQSAIERRHGAVEAGLVVVDPHRQHAREHQRRALRAQRAARTGRADAGGFQHPMLRAHRHGVEREREARIAPRRAHDRAHRFLVGRERLQPAHQHVEQPLARRLLRHVGVAAGEHRAVDVLDVSGEDRERRAELGAQLRKLETGAAGDFGQADLLEGMLGQQRHQRVDRLVAVAGAARRRRGSALCVHVSACGP